MMDPLEVSGPLPDFDNLGDVNLDDSGGLNFDLGSADIDGLLDSAGSADGGKFKFKIDESDMDNVMKEGPPLVEEPGGETTESSEFDHLKAMPIAEVDHPDALLGFDAEFEDYDVNLAQEQYMGLQQDQAQWNTNDPLLGSMTREMIPEQSESMNMIVNQGNLDRSSLQNGMLPPMGQSQQQQANVANLQNEKQKLMDRLNQIKMREEQEMGGVPHQQQYLQQQQQQYLQQQQQQQHQQPMMGVTMHRNEHVPSMPPRSNNMFLQSNPSPFSAPVGAASAPVASVGGMGGGSGGETPLAAFLRSGRKSHDSAGPGSGQQRPAGLAGTPGAASIFSQNNARAQSQTKPQLFASMDRSAVSQEMVRKLSSRGMARSSSRGSGISLSSRQGSRGSSGNLGNASWGADPSSRKSGFRTSGILTKTHAMSKSASEAHLVKRGGLALSKKGFGSVSRENALYSMMKRNSSKNLIRRDDSSGGLLPTKRRGGSRVKLSLSRSVPALAVPNGGGSAPPQGGHNAVW